MPNWCSNRASISGPAPVIAKIKDILEGEQELLQWMVPEPNYETTTSDGWYNWRIQHWGTKWDITDVTIDNDTEEDSIEFSFCSAWAPPIDAFHTWAQADGRVQFTLDYWEPGVGFVGSFSYDGDNADDQYIDANSDPIEYKRIASDEWGYEEWEEPEPLTEWYKQGVEDKGLDK